MKKLIFINGTMGVGKSTVSEKLYKSIKNSCWVDGDWCWMMNPFEATDENKEMVLDNITYILNNFLENKAFDYIIFNWVMQQDAIISEVLRRLDKKHNYELYKITLMCSKEELETRIRKDIMENKRDIDSLNRSLERLPLYNNMDTIKVDVGSNDVQETVEIIKDIIGYQKE